MDPQTWAWLGIAVVAVGWPVIIVVAILILGPLVGAVIVALVGAVTRSVRGHRPDDEVENQLPADAFPELFETLRPMPAATATATATASATAATRNDSI